MTDSEAVDDESSDAAAVIEADLAQLAAERDELRVTAQRIQADFENYRKRMARENAAAVDRGMITLMEHGAYKVAKGLTTAAEVLSVTAEDIR